ncbi:protein kinase domain-containing protein [Sandaracinus amylolyticus]|uniref:protein kinase domain-containing protein n=1 Tax=Sandaracinus amylolyticus TaxID=927083 RepID=UPI001F20847D|nr:protein kinase [Sandaracinus amylolyticus]UJR82025.1 Serine/threonine protein kinase [Sandaracinus amylolyticus]
MNVAPGAVVAGRFRLELPLGSGGMADVWRAQDLATQRPVALKLLRPQIAASAEAMQRLKREGEVLSALSHPAIVRVETYGQLDNNSVFVAMELLEGETLGARMRRGPMQPLELAPIVTGTCAALAAAHAKSIVHRDLKPDNVFLVPLASGGAGEQQVKLLDFGISKVFGGDRLTYTGEVLGTPRYMSPEQLGAEPDIDPRADVYALGVILYEAMAAKPPFLASTPTDLIVAILHGKVAPLRSLRPDLTSAIEAVVMRAMARAREARWASATDLADAFLDAAGATSRARALPKKVLRTQALGGAGLVGPGSVPPPPQPAHPPPASAMVPSPAPRAGASSDALRPGTFSAFGVIDETELRASVPGPKPAPATLVMASADAPSPVAVPVAARPEVAPSASRGASDSWREQTQSPPRASATASSSGWDAPSPAPPSNPMLGRLLLIVAGLVAGAISAAIAVAALHYMRAPDAPAPPATTPTPATSAPAPSVTPPPVSPEPAPDEAEPESADELPVAPDVPEEAPRPTTRRTRRERTAAPEPAPVEPEPAPTTLDPLELASRALAEGDPNLCITILDQLIAHGATPFAIKRRADCELRAGRRADAIRDYQRFCQIAPDHPAISTVREQLAGMGLTCP